MKKTILAALFFSAISGFSQRHLKGTFGVGAEGGLTKFGYYAGPSVDYNLTSKLYLKGDLLGEFGTIKLTQTQIQLRSYYVDVSCYYNLFKLKDRMYFNGGLGVQGQYAFLKDENKGVGSFTQNIPGIGFYVSPEIEYFISDKFVAMLNYRQAYYVKNSFGKNVAFYGAGLKYNL